MDMKNTNQKSKNIREISETNIQMKNIIFLFSFILMLGVLSAGSITGTVFDSDTGLGLEDVQISTTGLMDTCIINVYVNGTLDHDTAPLPVGKYDILLSDGSIVRSVDAISVGALGIFKVEHPVDGIFNFAVPLGANSTRTFSDGTEIKIELVDTSIQQVTTLLLTDASGQFLITGLSDDNFDLQFTKTGYNMFTFGPIRIDNSDPARTDRTIPNGILVMYPDGSVPTQPVGSIAGYVYDTDSAPINNANVEVYFDGNLIQTIQTDATGFFNLTNLDFSGQYVFDFSATDYLPETRTINLDLSTNPNLEIPTPIELVYIGNTDSLTGYVIDSATGDPIENALIQIPLFNLEDLTDNNGYYNIQNIPINFPIAVNVYAFSYFDGGINPITIPAGGREHNFTLTFDSSYVKSNGTLEGYVFDNSNNPINSARVEIAGIQNTTNASGYYIVNNIPEGFNQRARADRSGYDSELSYVNILGNQITTQNFTLQRDDSDNGGGSSGSSSSSSSPPSSSAQSITPPHTSLNTIYVNGCPIKINRDIEREEDETTVTLELTNECDEDVENIELREYPPEEAVLSKIKYSIEPKQVYLQPLVLIWEIMEIKSGETMEFVYTMDKEIESNKFDAKIFSLTDEEEYEPIQKVELLVPKTVFLGDNVTLTLKSENNLIIPNAKIIIISPFGKEIEVLTDEEGKAFFIPEQIGEYTYKVDKAILITSVSTQVTEVYVPTTEITQDIEIEKEDEPLGLAAIFGDIGESWPILLGLVFGILVILAIVFYFTSKTEDEFPHEVKPEIHIEEEQRPIFDEINMRQIKGDEKTILEEIKRREVKKEKTKTSKTNTKTSKTKKKPTNTKTSKKKTISKKSSTKKTSKK